ncbi:MAG: FadR family transcriptional regulator [Betaproteobacteria bacterium]|nr:FadR family transcriptional regulator [Betaproteobacteria bacterium]NBS45676.1 FadR family transcriptional regulator [Betaproteobacteria bacterium]
MPLQTIEPQRLYRHIAEQLLALIEQGEYPPGTRLPSERELAQQLGVSRPSVREALIALEVEGWVEVRTGSGVYVIDRPQTHAAEVPAAEWGPLELIRARRVVEGETAALAARHARRKDTEAMQRALQSMRDDAARGVMPLAGDRAFHLAIVGACGNVVLTETVETYWDARGGQLFERLGDHFESEDSWRTAIAEHEAIVTAIHSHDPEAARTAMHVHLDRSHARFSASWRRARHRAISPSKSPTTAKGDKR